MATLELLGSLAISSYEAFYGFHVTFDALESQNLHSFLMRTSSKHFSVEIN